MFRAVELLVALVALCRQNYATSTGTLHGLFYKDSDDAHVYYGILDLDVVQFNLISSLSIDDLGNPKLRKYSTLPMTYDPNSDTVFVAATSKDNKAILSAINATTGSILHRIASLPNTIVSLQFDIFQKQLFAHLETNIENSSTIVEIDTNNGTIIRTLATIDNARPTDTSTYCPICRKYFFFVTKDQQSVYVGVDTTDTGGISWQTPMNFNPLSMKFDYKTFTMYTAYINQSNALLSMIGILNRTIGGISDVVAQISDRSQLFVTSLAAFDIAEKIYYASNILTWPYSLGISYANVNTSQQTSVSLASIQYSPYGIFIKQFVH